MDQSEREYGNLLDLEELESMLEELEEAGADGDLHTLTLPADLAVRVASSDMHSVVELRARIAALHAKLDREEFD